MKCVMLIALLIAWSSSACPGDCTRRDAVRATVPEIARHPDEYMDKCVLVDGVRYGHSLFATVDGVYVRSPDALDHTKSGLRIGIDGDRNGQHPGYRHVSVLGRIQDCEAIRQMVQASAGPDEVVMVMGYCHMAYGPYVRIQQIRYRSGVPFVRQTGNYDRADYGDIEPVPANWPHRAMIEAQADRFLSALRARDRRTLAGLASEEQEADTLRFLLDDPSSPFASLRTSTTTPQTIVLSYRYLVRPRPEDEPIDDEDYSAIVCFCRETDCSERWPLASFDADNLPERPYACTKIEPYVSDGKDVPHFVTPAGKTGLAEPTRRAR